MIVWFMDRFGVPGHYHRIWVRLLRDNYIPTNEVKVFQLHKLLPNRQLLTKIGSRKAPTWVPDEEERITATIDNVVSKLKARAVVLAAPESLACLGLAPEHATLHNLRGSVYWRSGVPHIVMLPMSAWNAMVSQKEIGAANYGFESQDAFAAGRTGAIPQQGRDSQPQPTGNNPDGGNGSGGGVGNGGQSPFSRLTLGAAGSGGSRGFGSNGHTGAGSGLGEGSPDNNSGNLHEELPVEGDSDADSLSDADAGEGSDSIADGGTPRSHSDEDRGGGTVVRDPESVDDSGGDLRSDVGGSEDGDGEDSVVSDIDNDEPDREAGEVDQFFYEPVLSPVGRFVLTADTQKLFRILRDGENAAGPARPIAIDWR